MKKTTFEYLIFLGIFFLCLTVILSPTKTSAESVKVGIIGHMGFFSGDYMWRGAVVAAEEINKAGGVLGKKIELVKVHSNEMVSVPDAASAMEKLITVDKPAAVIGGLRSEATLAMQDVACDYQVIFFGNCAHFKPLAKVAENYDRYKYYFKAYPNAAYMGATLGNVVGTVADVVRKELGIKTPKVAILGAKAMWVEPLVKKIKAEAPALGIEIVGEWRPSARANDLTAELTAIKASGAHQICSAFAGPAGTAFGKQWYDLKIPAAMSGINGVMWDSKGYLKATKAEYSATWDPGGQARIEMTSKTIPFWDSYFKKWGDGPSFVAAFGYDHLHLWKTAVEKAGSFNPDAVVKELERTDTIGALSRIVFESKKHRWPHGGKFGKGYMTYSAIQLVGGKVNNFWPVPDRPKEWGIEYKGTVPYQLPPWMVTRHKK